LGVGNSDVSVFGWQGMATIRNDNKLILFLFAFVDAVLVRRQLPDVDKEHQRGQHPVPAGDHLTQCAGHDYGLFGEGPRETSGRP